MRWWKWLGVAGFAGVAAGGILIARDERRRLAYTPAEIRERLHQRLAEATDVTRSDSPCHQPPGALRGHPGIHDREHPR